MTDAIVYKNVLSWRGCEKLYLDERTCDVNFLFKSPNGEYEKIAAHKSILSSVSPVFDAMFYGPYKQTGDINIIDSTPDAFREFLQFFYLSTVKLSAENIPEVMYLGKEHMLPDCLKACTHFCESTLNISNICWGYELAILFEQNELKRFCERKISESPVKIFESNSFLTCEPNLLRHILQLNSLKCDESIVFDGCMAWAKAACIQKNIDEKNAQNLRTELGDLFGEIRFGRMKVEHFYSRYLLYDGLFTEDEFKEIIRKIAFKDFQPRSFNRITCTQSLSTERDYDNEDIFICNRMDLKQVCNGDNLYRFQTGEIYPNMCIDRTKFRSNCSLLLKRIVCQVGFCRNNKDGEYSTEAKIRINEAPTHSYTGNLMEFLDVSLSNKGEVIVELSAAVEIKAGIEYNIEIELETGITYTSERVLEQVRMDHGIIVDFFNDNGLVKCLHFSNCAD